MDIFCTSFAIYLQNYVYYDQIQQKSTLFRNFTRNRSKKDGHHDSSKGSTNSANW